MRVLKGIDAARAVNEDIKSKLAGVGRSPKLAIVRIGERPDDISYERGILKKMDTLGIGAEVHTFPEDISNEDFQGAFKAINDDDKVDGILCFMPMPKQIDAGRIAETIDPHKDMDGISPVNQAKIYAGDDSGYAPCTAEAVITLLDHYDIDVTGKRVTVIGRSPVIGRPVSMMLMKKNATVTICHTRTKDVAEECRRADIIVAAAGVPKMVTADFVSQGAIAIDVGIHVDEDGNMCGDVDYEAVADRCEAITPVPGGVGSVTTSVLADHVKRSVFCQGSGPVTR